MSTEPERFFAIRRTDGELIFGDYGWMRADAENDWTVGEESVHDEPTEYEIVEMTVRPVAKRTFGRPRCEDCGEEADEVTGDADGNMVCATCASSPRFQTSSRSATRAGQEVIDFYAEAKSEDSSWTG